ncbi:fibronectin type III domain-containing protein-like isoform X2 [Oculina patagonica]
MEKVYRILFAGWLFSFMAAVITATSSLRQPPMITKFTQKDLINPKDVTDFFALPCEASGTNLTWTWKHNDKQITDLNGKPYSLSKNGTLIGKSLAPILGGTYQCFVKDEATGVEVFSRKLQVTVTVAGTFTDRTDVVKMVDLGQPFQFQCPQHTAGFGATYNWFGELSDIALARNERRGISPKGTLFISHVTQQDISDIEGLKRIKCRMMAGHFYYDSGTLKLQKKNPDPNTPFKPYWADYPQAEEIAIEGRSKTLYCFAMGRPAPKITWKKNGREIIHGQNSFEIPRPYHGRLLTITNVSKTSHQDVYTCEAENSENTLVHSINLVVKVPPRWTKGLPPRKIDVIIRRNHTIECKVTADPEANITWYKNGKPLRSPSDHLRVDGNKLHLVNVNLTDDGVYQCAAVNKYGMIVSATWVHVRAWKPSFANGQFGPFSLLHGSEGRMQCKPSAEPPPTFQWFRNGVLISDGVSSRYTLQPDGTLVIKKVDKDKDSVNYTCKAQNMMGQDSATTVPVILVRPSFITKPQNRTVIEKETVTFHCKASGNPIPSITWVKDGKTEGTGNILRFQPTRYQSGRYWCLAENGLNVTIKASADLNVQFLPIFTKRPTDRTVKEGEEATFYCTATGNPTPKLTWLKDGKTVGAGETLKVVAYKNNSGNYWCSADNGLGLAINISAYLNVQFQPRLIAKPRDQTVNENKTVTFYCNATGNPTPKITWTKDGKTVGTGSELTFVALRSDAGRYWCSADNGLSAGVKADAYLRVLTVPFPPTDVKISDCSDRTAKLSWTPVPSNDAPITHYLIEQQSDGIPVVFKLLLNVTNPSTTSVTLNLTRGSVLRFRVKAVNSVGASRPSLTVETTCKSDESKVDARKVKETPIFHKAWFLTILVLVAYVLLFALLAVLYRRYKGKGVKYNVRKRERKRGLRDEEAQTEEEIGEEERNSLVVDARDNPPEEKQEPDRRSRPISTYSLFEVQFKEDGSFTEEYGEGDEMIQNIQGTFV